MLEKRALGRGRLLTLEALIHANKGRKSPSKRRAYSKEIAWREKQPATRKKLANT